MEGCKLGGDVIGFIPRKPEGLAAERDEGWTRWREGFGFAVRLWPELWQDLLLVILNSPRQDHVCHASPCRA